MRLRSNLYIVCLKRISRAYKKVVIETVYHVNNDRAFALFFSGLRGHSTCTLRLKLLPLPLRKILSTRSCPPFFIDTNNHNQEYVRVTNELSNNVISILERTMYDSRSYRFISIPVGYSSGNCKGL